MANPTRLKHEFIDDSAREQSRRKCVADLVLDFTDRWGAGAIIDLTPLNDRLDLARSFALALFDFCEPGGTVKRFLTIHAYYAAIKIYFWPFLSDYESRGNPRVLKPQDVGTSTLQEFIDWLRQSKLGEHHSYVQYLTVARILSHLSEAYPELMAEGFEAPRYPLRGVWKSVAHRAPYSDREALEIERASLKEMRATVLRLQQGTELLRLGKDPRGHGSWNNVADILWYIKNVLGGRYLTAGEYKNDGHEELRYAIYRRTRLTKRDIYSYLYPLLPELIPPLILICLKTGLNPQPATELRRNCLKSVPDPGKIGLIATKHRGGGTGPKTFMKIVDDRSSLGPGGIIRTFMGLTDACLPLLPAEDRDYLWVALNLKSSLPFCRLKAHELRKRVRSFAARNDLIGDDGQPLQLQLPRLRTTWLTKRYKAAGNLAAVSREANHRQTRTTRGYIDNEHTLPIHEQTIAEALHDFFNSVRGRVITQQADRPDQVAHVARLTETTEEKALAMLRGEQDTFISTCRDFYNRPGGPADTPCDRSWSCFTCKNAYWTSRTLPRLLRFLDFIVEQRGLLTAEDWREKFGVPYEAITEHILPAFPKAVVSEARLQAEQVAFTVPFSLKVV